VRHIYSTGDSTNFIPHQNSSDDALLLVEEYFQLIFSVKNIRPSLTTSKEALKRITIHNETIIIYLRLLGGQFFTASYGQEQWFPH
jgi:hypothetical protein